MCFKCLSVLTLTNERQLKSLTIVGVNTRVFINKVNMWVSFAHQ